MGSELEKLFPLIGVVYFPSYLPNPLPSHSQAFPLLYETFFPSHSRHFFHSGSVHLVNFRCPSLLRKGGEGGLGWGMESVEVAAKLPQHRESGLLLHTRNRGHEPRLPWSPLLQSTLTSWSQAVADTYFLGLLGFF